MVKEYRRSRERVGVMSTDEVGDDDSKCIEPKRKQKQKKSRTIRHLYFNLNNAITVLFRRNTTFVTIFGVLDEFSEQQPSRVASEPARGDSKKKAKTKMQ